VLSSHSPKHLIRSSSNNASNWHESERVSVRWLCCSVGPPQDTKHPGTLTSK
jgi:hypothetical protein